jgi:bacterioferritin-associated ferredoxin
MGVQDLPPVFAGEVAEKLELEPSSGPLLPMPPVVVADVLRIPDFDQFWSAVLASRARFRVYGGIRCWAYRAFDDPAETLLLREVASEDDAKQWLRRTEERTAWKRGASIVAPYPPLFLGRLVQAIAVPSDAAGK